jgi:spore maturation protein CgeB
MNSRAVVSTNCSNGANERTFDAQSCGAISIAENSETLKNEFEDMKDIIFYDRLYLKNKTALIEEVMKNKSKGILIAEEGYQKYKKNNTWKHRVDDLYKVLEKIHFSQSSKVCA